MRHVTTQSRGSRIAAGRVHSLFVTLTAGLALAIPAGAQAAINCARNLSADVVVFDQPLMFNRLGSQNVNGIIYALGRDVVNKVTGAPCAGACTAGNVALRPDKRPRPLVLRMAAGDCLDVTLTNLLAPTANPNNAPDPLLLVDDQVVDRRASFHAQGLELRADMQDDGSYVGKNKVSGLVAPNASATYKYYAPREGTYLVTSHGATFGSDGSAGNNTNGMFAVVNVEPAQASFYRSQVTEEEMRLALDTGNAGSCPSPPRFPPPRPPDQRPPARPSSPSPRTRPRSSPPSRRPGSSSSASVDRPSPTRSPRPGQRGSRCPGPCPRRPPRSPR
jgi:hypothetical protein